MERGHSWLIIRWPQVDFAVLYTVTHSADGGEDVTTIDIANKDLLFDRGMVFSNVSGLAPGTGYSFAIEASGGFGESATLDGLSATTRWFSFSSFFLSREQDRAFGTL